MIENLGRMGPLDDGRYGVKAPRSGAPVFYVCCPSVSSWLDSVRRTASVFLSDADYAKKKRAMLLFVSQHVPYGAALRQFIEPPRKK